MNRSIFDKIKNKKVGWLRLIQIKLCYLRKENKKEKIGCIMYKIPEVHSLPL